MLCLFQCRHAEPGGDFEAGDHVYSFSAWKTVFKEGLDGLRRSDAVGDELLVGFEFGGFEEVAGVDVAFVFCEGVPSSRFSIASLELKSKIPYQDSPLLKF